MLTYFLLLAFIGIAAGLAWFLLAHDHGPREPIGALWLAAAFGLAGSVVAAFLEARLIPAANIMAGTPYGTLLLTTLGIGVIEELCKFLPLALFIYRRSYFNEHTDGVIYFALAGLGFGLPENILYTLEFGNSAGMVRVVMTPLFHAAVTALVGYYLVKGKLAGRSVFAVGLPLTGAILLHSLYDFGLASGSLLYAAVSLLITLGLSIGLFVTFQRAGERDQEMGLSAVGHNAFCRACGYPNPHHYLYCVHCGKNA